MSLIKLWSRDHCSTSPLFSFFFAFCCIRGTRRGHHALYCSLSRLHRESPLPLARTSINNYLALKLPFGKQSERTGVNFIPHEESVSGWPVVSFTAIRWTRLIWGWAGWRSWREDSDDTSEIGFAGGYVGSACFQIPSESLFLVFPAPCVNVWQRLTRWYCRLSSHRWRRMRTALSKIVSRASTSKLYWGSAL